MTAQETPGFWFVLRSPHEPPPGKRVLRVAAPSILAWFQAMIEEARISLTPHRTADRDLGGPVPGLPGLFEAAKEQSLHTPKTPAALLKMLAEHVGAKAGPDAILHADAHAVRVFTRDDEGESAFVLFDDRWEAEHAPIAAALLDQSAPAEAFEPLRAARVVVPKPPKPPASKKPPAEKPAKQAAPRAPRPEAPALRHRDAWQRAIGGRDPSAAPPYRPSARFDAGALVAHPRFGVGVVARIEPTKIEVLFQDGPRLLVQGA
jgi:hypothetical protein